MKSKWFGRRDSANDLLRRNRYENARIPRCLFYASEVLQQAFQAGVDVKGMSAELRRTRADIPARLEAPELT